MSTAAQEQESVRTSTGRLGCVMIPVLLIASFTLYSCVVPSGPREVTEQSAITFGKDVCQDAMKNGLKAPGSADFSNESATANKVGDAWTVSVRGLVEAENSFGGTVGIDYECLAEVAANGDSTGRIVQRRQR